MEEFERYRKNLAKEIKESPKPGRETLLNAAKTTPDYEKAKELNQAKRGVYELTQTETLKNPEDPEEVANFIKSEIEDYSERHNAYSSGYLLEDVVGRITKYLVQRLKSNLEKLSKIKISDHFDQTTYNSFQEGTTHGDVSFMGRVILNYSSYDDGYGFSVDEWHEDNLRASVSDLLDHLHKT